MKHLLNGALVTHQDKDQTNGLEHTSCSTFIKKRQLLVKGEWRNSKSKERNAMIVLIDPKTGDFKGESERFCVSMYFSVLTIRPRVDIEQKICVLCVPLREQQRDLFLCFGG